MRSASTPSAASRLGQTPIDTAAAISAIDTDIKALKPLDLTFERDVTVQFVEAINTLTRLLPNTRLDFVTSPVTRPSAKSVGIGTPEQQAMQILTANRHPRNFYHQLIYAEPSAAGPSPHYIFTASEPEGAEQRANAVVTATICPDRTRPVITITSMVPRALKHFHLLAPLL